MSSGPLVRKNCVDLAGGEATIMPTSGIASLLAASVAWSDIDRVNALDIVPPSLRTAAAALQLPYFVVRCVNLQARLSYGLCTHILPVDHDPQGAGFPYRRFLIQLVDMDGKLTSEYYRVTKVVLLRTLVSTPVFEELYRKRRWPVDRASIFCSSFVATCPTCDCLAYRMEGFPDAFCVDHASHANTNGYHWHNIMV